MFVQLSRLRDQTERYDANNGLFVLHITQVGVICNCHVIDLTWHFPVGEMIIPHSGTKRPI